MPIPLPRDEYGHVETSAAYGHSHLVVIEWNTDWDERRIDYKVEEYPTTTHGPFFSEAEAQEWMDDYPDDTDIHDMTLSFLNHVRPQRQLARKTRALMRPL